jgi:hypothetical protein
MSQLTNKARTSACNVPSWSYAPWECRHSVRADIVGVDTVQLLVPACGWDTGVKSETATDTSSWRWGQIVHLSRHVHSVGKIMDGLTCGALHKANVTKTWELLLGVCGHIDNSRLNVLTCYTGH